MTLDVRIIKIFVKTALLVCLLFLLRYLFSVFVVYLVPSLNWQGERPGTSFLNSPNVMHAVPEAEPANLWQFFDSNFFMGIVLNGYDDVTFDEKSFHNWAFYPLYPSIVKTIATSFNFLDDYRKVFLVGIVVSNACFIAAILFLRKLCKRLEVSKDKFLTTLLLILAFPSSYFFQLFYAESLFLALSLLFFLALFKQKYFLSAIILGLALITRIHAVALVPALLVYMIMKERKKHIGLTLLKAPIYLLLAFLPLFGFFSFLKATTGNFFAAIMIQNAWGNTTFYPLNYFIKYFSLYGLSIPFDQILSVLFLLACIMLFIVLFASFLKKKYVLPYRIEYLSLFLYAAAYLVLLTSTNNLSSVFRYASSNFAFFLLPVAFIERLNVTKPLLFFFLCASFIVLQTLFFLFFITKIPAYGF